MELVLQLVLHHGQLLSYIENSPGVLDSCCSVNHYLGTVGECDVDSLHIVCAATVCRTKRQAEDQRLGRSTLKTVRDYSSWTAYAIAHDWSSRAAYDATYDVKKAYAAAKAA